MTTKYRPDIRGRLGGLTVEKVAMALVVVFLLSLCLYVTIGVIGYDDDTRRIMTTTYKERIEETREEDPKPITPGVEERFKRTVRDYVLTMLFLVGFFLALSVWNIRTEANLQAPICAVTLIIAVGCSHKVLYAGFYGLRGEAGFIAIGCLVMVAAFLVWYGLKLRLNWFMYTLAVAVVVILLVLNVKAIQEGKTVNGEANWIKFLGVRIQASEFIKAGLILIGACSSEGKLRKYIYSLLAVASCMVVALAGDIGGAVVMACLFFIMVALLFDEEWLSFALAVGFALAFVVVWRFSATAQDRMAAWGKVFSDSDYIQQQNILVALAKGGWQGLGLDKARSFFGIVFVGADGAVAGVQAIYGLGMLLVLFGSFAALILRFAISKCVNKSSRILLIQVAVLFTAQLLLNYLGSTDVLPFTGICAPFVSTGGSSMVATCGLCGCAGAALYSRVDTKKVRLE